MKIVHRMDDFHPIPVLVSPCDKNRRRRDGTRSGLQNWLRVEGDQVLCRFVGDRDATQAMPLEAFRNQIAAVEAFGRGTLEIGDFGLGEGGCPIIQ